MSGTTEPARVIVGRINGLFGIHGWVKIFSYTQPRENILTYYPWYVAGTAREREADRTHGKGIVAKFKGFDDRDAVTALLNAEISIDRSQLPVLKPDEYYWADLLGLEVRNRQDIALGRVKNFLETGVHDVLVVYNGEQERLIPFVPGHFIDRVDLSGGLIYVDWPIEF
jgi:16S rRNA processing protein RimM